MKYMIYLAIAVLVVWSVWYLLRHVKRQLHGDCGSCGGGCDGNCGSCGKSCKHK